MFYRNLNKCFDLAGVSIAEMYLAPLALADSVLTDAEKRSGCALVDLGADTTTVSVYYKNILRHLAVIPLGSNNITKDIASLQMEESNAEQMKLRYGSAWTDNGEIDNALQLNIDQDRSVESRKFVEIVEGRVEEIIENVWYQVPSDYADRLLGGLILTGGGSNMKNIETAFRNHTHIDKIRIAKFVQQTISAKDPLITARNGMMNTVLALLAKGDMNCAGAEVDGNGDLFGENKQPAPNDLHREPRKPNELSPGVVQTEAEKQKAEEERRRQEEAEEAARQAEIQAEAERLRQEEEERRRKENSGLKKTGKKIKNFLKSLISEPEDE
jgi:cell division protein FtsA